MTTSDTTRVEWIAAIKIIKLPDESAGLSDDGNQRQNTSADAHQAADLALRSADLRRLG
jgi:hypothetical protein